MKNVFGTLLVLSISCSVFALEKTERFQLKTNLREVDAGKINYQFQILDGKKSLVTKDLIESHTKLMHVIVYDASLNEFRHVHPKNVGRGWKADFTLDINGDYFIWAQGETSSDDEFSVFAPLKIKNGKPAIPVVDLTEKRSGTDGATTVTVAADKISAGQMTTVNYTVSRTDAKVPKITPYLGAQAHVVAVSPNGKDILHVHPMNGEKPNTGMVHVTFPSPGTYRLWFQLNDNDELKTIPVAVTVTK